MAKHDLSEQEQIVALNEADLRGAKAENLPSATARIRELAYKQAQWVLFASRELHCIPFVCCC